MASINIRNKETKEWEKVKTSVIPVDKTLTVENMPADAKAVGEALSSINNTSSVTNLENGTGDGAVKSVGANEASGKHSFAEGKSTTAFGDYSHAEGGGTTASGEASHAEGYGSTASGKGSHAEGGGYGREVTHKDGSTKYVYGSYAFGELSHAEGCETFAEGIVSHAEGSNTKATGGYSHAEGLFTTAGGEFQHVQGRNNIEDDQNTYAHIVGNGIIYGETNIPSNAHTLDWSGNAWFAGDVYVGSTSGTNKDEGSKKLVTVDEMNAAIAAAIEAAFVNIARAEEVRF